MTRGFSPRFDRNNPLFDQFKIIMSRAKGPLGGLLSLSMDPDMGLDQWLLVTMTAGVGGSLQSVGSAAGVAFFGHANGKCSFTGHLKWRWAIALGYAGRIYVHFLING